MCRASAVTPVNQPMPLSVSGRSGPASLSTLTTTGLSGATKKLTESMRAITWLPTTANTTAISSCSLAVSSKVRETVLFDVPVTSDQSASSRPRGCKRRWRASQRSKRRPGSPGGDALLSVSFTREPEASPVSCLQGRHRPSRRSRTWRAGAGGTSRWSATRALLSRLGGGQLRAHAERLEEGEADRVAAGPQLRGVSQPARDPLGLAGREIRPAHLGRGLAARWTSPGPLVSRARHGVLPGLGG